MALYAFDGTGNEDKDKDKNGNDLDSNVLDFFRGYKDPDEATDPKNEFGSIYFKGIGTRARTLLGKKFAEAFGIGGHKRIRDAMERLENNFEAGDTDVDIIGFSRGAAIAISFANKLNDRFPSLQIRFLGVWDIVGQFGLPGENINAGHDLGMPKNVKNCFHAMALDESRALFPLTRLGGAVPTQEVWFRGVHSDVGGGNGNAVMNSIALHWMYQNALRCGLPIKDKAVESNLRDGMDAAGNPLPRRISKHSIDLEIERKIHATDLLHVSVSFDPDPDGRRHNNPPDGMVLARVDDSGALAVGA